MLFFCRIHLFHRSLSFCLTRLSCQFCQCILLPKKASPQVFSHTHTFTSITLSLPSSLFKVSSFCRLKSSPHKICTHTRPPFFYLYHSFTLIPSLSLVPSVHPHPPLVWGVALRNKQMYTRAASLGSWHKEWRTKITHSTWTGTTWCVYLRHTTFTAHSHSFTVHTLEYTLLQLKKTTEGAAHKVSCWRARVFDFFMAG